jgi:hypothetical protein
MRFWRSAGRRCDKSFGSKLTLRHILETFFSHDCGLRSKDYRRSAVVERKAVGGVETVVILWIPPCKCRVGEKIDTRSSVRESKGI